MASSGGGGGIAWALGQGPTALTEIAVVSPPGVDPMLAEAITRLRSELGAMALSSYVVSCADDVAAAARACEDTRAVLRRDQRAAATAAAPDPTSPDPTSPDPTSPVPTGPARSTPAPLGSDGPAPGDAPSPSLATAALVALGREDGVTTIEVIERLASGSTYFRLVYVPSRDGGKDPAVLAIRAVELLRDLHMDVERGEAVTGEAVRSVRRARETEVPPAPDGPAEPDPDLEPERYRRRVASQEPGPWRVGLALAGLQGRSGLGPSVGAALEGSFAVRPWLTAFALGSGPFFDDLRGGGGTGTARQELVLAGARIASRARLRPYGAAGLGVMHVKVQGTSATSPTSLPISATLWAFALTAGAGAAYRATRFIDVRVEVDSVWAMPSGEITIADEVAGRVGAPSILALAGVWIALP